MPSITEIKSASEVDGGALRSWKSTLKSAIKEVTPPIFLRYLRPAKPHTDPWRNLQFSREGNTLVLPGEHRFLFRPSREDREVCRQVFFYRDYALDRLARRGDLMDHYSSIERPLIVDAGANIGAATVWFSLTFPKARVVAIEPDTENFRLLAQNTAQFPLVSLHQGAIASAPGQLFLNDPGGGAWAYRTTAGPGPGSYAVKAMTIEEVASSSDATPFILKIDIEGAEQELFSRHAEILDQFPLIVIELHDWMLPRSASSQNFLRWHAARDRDFVFSGENVFSISNSIGT